MNATRLLAENDGSARGPGCRHWCRLAVYAVGGSKEEYLALIQFYAHPAKEPFQVARRVDSPADVAAFLLSCDPVTVLRHNRACGLDMDLIRGRYDFQLRDLLADFAKALADIKRREQTSVRKTPVSPSMKGVRPCFTDFFSLAL